MERPEAVTTDADPPPLHRSGSIANPTYWWYRAREGLMRQVFAESVSPGAHALEIGSADGPSTRWLDARTRRIATDTDPAGLRPGDVCADARTLPFPDHTFDVVGAFDVIEHIPDPIVALSEMRRVLRPNGLLLLSVPAYTWAWTEFDVRAGHQRRYTRPRLGSELRAASFDPVRITHAFAGPFPFFALDRLLSRVTRRSATNTGDGNPGRLLTRLLLGLCWLEERLIGRVDMAFGSSVFAMARPSGQHLAGTQAEDLVGAGNDHDHRDTT